MEKLIIDNECLENLRKGLEHGDISDIARHYHGVESIGSKISQIASNNVKVGVLNDKMVF